MAKKYDPEFEAYCDRMEAAITSAKECPNEYSEGYMAGCQGKSSGFNPYPSETGKHIAWSQGWQMSAIDPKE